MIQFNKKEALRYFRAQSNDKSAETLVDAAYQKLKNELQPRYTVKRLGCRADAESVLLDNGTVFRSKALARYVGEATELFLFGATLGSRVDIALRRMALTRVAEAGAGQAVAAALIETYCDDCCAELQKQLPEGKKLKWRFSPGYGDWALEEQKILFPVLDCAHTIGLTLTESCMMAPVKSVTAVMAITEDDEEDKEINNTIEMKEISTTNSENEDNVQRSNSGQNFLMKDEPDLLLQERDNEIVNIVKGVNTLHEMFKDMNILVNEQGTILDRIDYNIDIGFDNVVKAKKKINNANESRKGCCFRNIILVLMVCIFVESMMILFKFL